MVANSSTSPLQVVLGSLASSTYHTECAAKPAATATGTSTSILATSALKLKIDGRVPMEDRKTPLSQFRPRTLLLSTFRVAAINTSSTLSTYFSDQLESEQANEKLVDDGEITAYEADEMNEEWEQREWQARMDLLPRKIGIALVRFHSCTALMRFYEFIMGRYILCVDGRKGLEIGSSPARGYDSTYENSVDVMDKLTRDTFQASLRTSQLLQNQEHSPGKVLSSDGKETSTSNELYKRMYTTCLWANIIPFLAELTVQHGILLYGYGVYYMEKKRRRKEREMIGREGKECNNEQDDSEPVDESAYALSILFRSSHLTFSRGVSLIAASIGGAVGSVLYPGWGAILGIQIGDTSVAALLD